MTLSNGGQKMKTFHRSDQEGDNSNYGAFQLRGSTQTVAGHKS